MKMEDYILANLIVLKRELIGGDICPPPRKRLYAGLKEIGLWKELINYCRRAERNAQRGKGAD
jgi:hypothetical protein